MRLHDLQITAFGPFAETVSIDFDDLSSAGLFLLTGPTGSGKTSILDAVSFALYGDVPGERSSAKRFRCDTAAPGVAPRVRLETTISGRRFRLTRSPAWSRAKKRGTGTTTENASVVIEERIDGEWVALSTRLDEAGHLITEVIGMTMPQFCQVAMLPQGRFQMFLRAKSDDRHTLLQQLFSTKRFQDIERWIREHTRGLHRQSQESQRTVSRVVSRVLETTGVALPDEWSEDDLSSQMADGALLTWLQSLVATADEQAVDATALLRRVEGDETAARERRDVGQRVAALQARASAAHDEHRRLLAEEGEHKTRQSILADARRAFPVVRLDRLATTATQQHDRALDRALTARGVVEELVGLRHPSTAALTQMVRDLGSSATLTSTALPREAELVALRTSISTAREQIRELEATESEAHEHTESLPTHIEDLRRRLAEARQAATDSARLAETISLLDHQLDAHARVERLRAEVTQAENQHSSAVDECQSLKEHWLVLTESRIRGMAAEIATALAVGSSCPVCGSADHPSKAQPSAGAATAETEKTARAAVDDAEAERAALDAKVHELRSTLTHASDQAGPEKAVELKVRRDGLEATRSAASDLAGTIASLEASETHAERDLQSSSVSLARTRVALAEARIRLENDDSAQERIEHDISDLLAGSGHDTLTGLLAHQQKATQVCDAALHLTSEADTTADRAAQARSGLDDWLAENDFSTVDQALDAVLPENEVLALEQQVTEHQTRLATVAAVLEDPDVAAAVDEVAPDLAHLEHESSRLREELTVARTHSQLSSTRQTRLTALHEELESSIGVWRPVHTAYIVAAELASFVEGKSTENDLRMRLSAYVLAWRLTQVVAAANERLVQMTGQRYTLEHTGRRGAGESRGGLSLMVLDEWSGELRDPATLSGGETFVVSLALALGLADVVTQEAGGAELDTLFVDEGFGSLDSETLDDVMDTLDTLRDGGRVVGVVSHVAEMRSRIPTQLNVSKDRTGSSVAITRSGD